MVITWPSRTSTCASCERGADAQCIALALGFGKDQNRLCWSAYLRASVRVFASVLVFVAVRRRRKCVFQAYG